MGRLARVKAAPSPMADWPINSLLPSFCIGLVLDLVEIPARAVFAGKIFIGVGVVGDGAARGVISQRGAGTKGGRIEVDRFRDVFGFAEGARVLLSGFYGIGKGLDGGGISFHLVLPGGGRSGFHPGAGEDLRIVDVEA